MRAIKFRVWLPTWKNLISAADLDAYDVFVSSLGVVTNCSPEIGKHSQWLDAVISQFTGLLDRDRVEIYEGDIVRSEYSSLMYIVEWSGDLPGWLPFLDQLSGEDYEVLTGHRVKVVGNRWENPALAEECE